VKCTDTLASICGFVTGIEGPPGKAGWPDGGSGLVGGLFSLCPEAKEFVPGGGKKVQRKVGKFDLESQGFWFCSETFRFGKNYGGGGVKPL